MAQVAAPRFCVLGRNVAGLTSAYLLQRSFPRAHVVLVEQGRGPDCQIRSVRRGNGHVFEAGFYSSILVNKNGRELLGLLRLLGLEDEVVSANIESSARRHLYHYGRVQLFPRVPHILRFCPPLLAEPLWFRSTAQDESVHAFVARRSSRDVADRIADPLCRGMLGGDARLLSVRTCFPRLWFNERRFRSVFVGSALSTLAAYRRRSWLSLDLLDPLLQRVSAGGRCYTLRNGLSSLVERLEERLLHPTTGARPAEILLGTSAQRIRAASATPRGPVDVLLDSGAVVPADAVVAALPPADLAGVLEASAGELPSLGDSGAGLGALCGRLRDIPHRSAGVANLRFEEDVLKGKYRGAGYFAGSLERQAVLGMSWDSQLFPSASAGAQLTVYVSEESAGSAADVESAALDALRTHLGVEADPTDMHSAVLQSALPQYPVGHHQLLRDLNAARLRSMPWLQVAGGGYYGTRGPADDVVDARQLADAIARRFARYPGLVENEVEEDVAQRYGAGFDAD